MGREQYLVKGAGMDRESTLYLIEQGVRVVGIDAWSWDRPLPFLAREFQETGDPSVVWEAHFAGIQRGYCHMEKLAEAQAARASKAMQMMQKGGAKVVYMSDQGRARWANKLPNVPMAWAQSMESKGLPGKAMLKGFLDGLRARGVKLVRNWDQ